MQIKIKSHHKTKRKKIRYLRFVLIGSVLLVLLLIYKPNVSAGATEKQAPEPNLNIEIIPQQSRSGPTPSNVILERDRLKTYSELRLNGTEVLLTVPSYLWRHGCGPTALGMVVGYYDMQGFSDLIPGDAWSQTNAVNQMIASGGTFENPSLPGSELHFENYSLPIDQYPTMLPDAYITEARSPHIDNSLADFMDTSKSTRSNYYGWSWSEDMGSSFIEYINLTNPTYIASYQAYYAKYTPRLTWEILKNEIDSGRPMVFLVDTDGNNSTDHFVTIIGYRDSPTHQYASWDTWSNSTVRWENFSYMASGVSWGIWGGWSFHLQKSIQQYSYNYLPLILK